MSAFALLLLAACAAPPEGSAPAGPEDTGAACAFTRYEAGEAWALPDDAPAGALATVGRAEADCEGGLAAVWLRDLTGDGRLDLVVPNDCVDPTVGRDVWWVWPGEAAGFGARLAWGLPGGFGEGAFAAEARDAASCGEEAALPAFFLADLDRDGADDLVVTADCDDPSLSAGAWRVHRSTGMGFGEGAVRAIPNTFGDGAFVAPRVAPVCEDGAALPGWGLGDLDGDGADDIVVTGACGAREVGARRWQVYQNDGAAFVARAWSTPPEVGAAAVALPDRCPAGPAFFPLDLDGDARPELVVPRPCTSAASEWAAYANDGSGFVAVPTLQRAPLFLNRMVDAPERAESACSRGEGAWVIDDATGDGLPDITITAACSDRSVGEWRWDQWVGAPGGWVEQRSVALPTGYGAEAFVGSGNAEPGCAGAGSRPVWARRDLDGDGLPEIVVTEACDDDAVGATSWRVHRLACDAG